MYYFQKQCHWNLRFKYFSTVIKDYLHVHYFSYVTGNRQIGFKRCGK